jgi:hypothetical protein
VPSGKGLAALRTTTYALTVSLISPRSSAEQLDEPAHLDLFGERPELLALVVREHSIAAPRLVP